MPQPRVSVETILQIAAAFPNVKQTTSWGAPSLKVRGQLMACVPTNKSAEPESFLFCLDRRDRDHLLAESPDLYYITDHYHDFDGVLVRLRLLTPGLAHDLLAMAHNFVTRQLPGARPGS